ncbi:MAG: hybrid sensor histidine kinase/response regulator [Desulfobulbaceae bacterium]|nr:hybrid sensor histidine kinase/response regulator [Desulfobulbaceae bacterium]
MELNKAKDKKKVKPVVVIVDDEKPILTELKILLGRSYRVHIFENPEDVEPFVDNNPVDMVVSDELMPEMRGSELLSRLHKKHPDVCKIVLSGQAEKNDIVRAINEGHIFSFLFKPVNQRQLINVIEKGLENRQMKLTLQKQNKELQNYSENLEKMVQERTTQLVKAHERVKQLDGNKMSFLVYLANEINSPLDRIQKLAETLLTYFGVSGSNLKPEMENVSLHDVVTRLLEKKDADIKGRNISIHNHVPQDISAQSDREYIERVLNIVIDNALYFTGEDGTIDLLVDQKEGKTRMTVKDTGCGIDPADLENIFTAFVLEPEKRRPNGFGLNLPLARIMSKALDGKIWAESAGKGMGATFYFEF